MVVAFGAEVRFCEVVVVSQVVVVEVVVESGIRFFTNKLDKAFSSVRVYFLNAGCEVYSLRSR